VRKPIDSLQTKEIAKENSRDRGMVANTWCGDNRAATLKKESVDLAAATLRNVVDKADAAAATAPLQTCRHRQEAAVATDSTTLALAAAAPAVLVDKVLVDKVMASRSCERTVGHRRNAQR
jgi:hypothetical protein